MLVRSGFWGFNLCFPPLDDETRAIDLLLEDVLQCLLELFGSYELFRSKYNNYKFVPIRKFILFLGQTD